MYAFLKREFRTKGSQWHCAEMTSGVFPPTSVQHEGLKLVGIK